MSTPENLLILGSGIQEHVFALKTKQSAFVGQVYALPGNEGMSHLCKCSVDISLADLPKIFQFIKENQISAIYLNPETVVKEELLDYIYQLPIKLLSPPREVFNIGKSRVELRQVASSRGIPFPAGHVFDNIDGVVRYCEQHNFPLVLKTDSNAKTAICQSLQQVKNHLHICKDIATDRERMIVENFVSGPIVTVSAIVYKNNITTFPYCQLLRDEDGHILGGCIPAPIVNVKTARNIERLILVPLISALQQMTPDYQGMITMEIAIAAKGPYLIECAMDLTPIMALTMLQHLHDDIGNVFPYLAEKRLEITSCQWNKATVGLILSDTSFKEEVLAYLKKPDEQRIENFQIFYGTYVDSTCLDKKSTVFMGLAANGEDFKDSCNHIATCWEKNFSENYKLYHALQMIKTLTGSC